MTTEDVSAWDDERDEASALLMPFVLCESKGGRFDDEAFTAGFALGALDRDLSLAAHSNMNPSERYMRVEYRSQADLIAMRHGFTLTLSSEQDGWSLYQFGTPDTRGERA
ncbi:MULTISPECIES: hypothetical protein [unclassified Microbacterium]|uniref:hypothetical protein n=1 Tax=unclassified Microbacterium TaxID=2609290 RepID=UPI002468AB64|nr:MULTISPECIES: hypothetical protein [unclassified Microbacterium]MDH5134050.1 hypothetical protein [Microbacterium sp. RD10]MDH5136846.1 hypothetical protein [Microbacterium sp. RD11]MDH5146890.1 hypothetical protein [Microbacterium sp. RD12]MDH5156584.1 hypothetical protein [Microbacterium sp. RD06]MDH5168077.1 hypothetical protein [Microbacterium sp. RD02]